MIDNRELHARKAAVPCAAFILLLSLGGCEAAIVGGECSDDTCSGNSSDNTPAKNPSPGMGGSVGNPPSSGGQGTGGNLPACKSDADCKAPLLCNVAGGKCVPPSAKNSSLCDPIEGNSCSAGQLCISGICMSPPGGCVTNDSCPIGYLCLSGACVPDTKGQPGCKKNSNCPSGQICINGDCKPKGACNIPHAKDRLKGNWKLDSKLHVRDGLKGLTKGLLSLASTMQSIIDGKFGISGLPGFVSGIISGIVQNMIKQFVPPWGTEVIKLLATIDDVIDDTRILSTEHLQAKGNDQYTGFSTWQLVEFEYKGNKVSRPPQNIPGLGPVSTTSYTAREVCGVLFIDQHKVKNQIGKLFRWAIEAVITGVSCAMKNVPCYTSINSMFAALVDCNKLASAVAAKYTYPGLNTLVYSACQAQKTAFVNLLIKELDDLALKMTYMSLQAKADVANSNKLSNGKWYGSLGGTYGKGNFEGTFHGVRAP